MADGNTPTYSLILPEIDGADGTWGVSLNTNLGSLDSLLSGGTALTAISVTGTVTAGHVAATTVTVGDSTGTNLELYEDSSQNAIIKQRGTGNLQISGVDGSLSNESYAQLVSWDADNVNLSWQGASGAGTKLATTETGIDVTGEVKGDTLTIDNSNGLNTAASVNSSTGRSMLNVISTFEGTVSEQEASIEIGANKLAFIDFKTPDTDDYDLRIYHSEPENLSMINSLNEDLFLRSGGKVSLQHAGANTKLETTSTGIDVTGTVTADAFTGHITSVVSSSAQTIATTSYGVRKIHTGGAVTYTFDATGTISGNDIGKAIVIANAGTDTITCNFTTSKFYKMISGVDADLSGSGLASITIAKGGVAEIVITETNKALVFGAGVA